MDYKEYKDEQQKKFNALPIFFAFSMEQFESALRKRGLHVDEAKEKVYRLSGGGFYLKKDAPQIREFFSIDRSKKLRELMEEDHGFAEDAFEYEMLNHEYPINWEGDYDVCSCFGQIDFAEGKIGADYLKELGFSPEIIAIYKKVARRVEKAIQW